MSSAATNRPSGTMATASRSIRFPEFGVAPGKQSTDSSPSSALGQTFGNGATWQPSGGIWNSNPIGSGYANIKKETSRSTAGDNDFADGLSGSKALAEQSEAEPWGPRTNGPWNPPDTTSPTAQSHSGSTSPSHTRNSIPNVPTQTLHEIQSSYQQSRPPIGQGASFRSQQKSSLNPSSGSFKFVQKPQPSFFYNDDKENSNQYANDAYDADIPVRYLAVGSVSRDTSMPPPRAVESGRNGGNGSYASGNQPFSSIGHHTPHSSIHSQRPSISGPVGSYSSQSNGMRYEIAPKENDLNESFAPFGLGRDPEGNSPLAHNSNDHSPNNSSFPQPQTFNKGSAPWSDGHGSKASISYDQYSTQPFAEQAAYLNNTARFSEKVPVSPAGSDYRRGLNSPKYYPAAATPSSGQDQVYRPNSKVARIPQAPADLNRRLQDIHIQQAQAQAYAHYIYAQYAHFPVNAYDSMPLSYRPANPPYGYPIQLQAYSPAPPIPTRPAKDQDLGAGVRSVLLEEFRSAKTNKKYDLREIYGHVVEFSGDQYGSRYIQQKLENANSDEKEQLFREIKPNALPLMTDVFGNYVIQKMFEHGNQVQKRVLAEQMKNHVMELSVQMYGCRVVQKALEHVLADQQAELAQELRADVLKCVKDQNGNHVVQKAIERVPTEHIRFVIDAFRGQVHTLATHAYGCRVIQRILEFCKPHDQVSILEEFHQCAGQLITDPFGNYVVQHVIIHGRPEDQAKVIKIVTSHLLTLSKHKHASNVVEKCIIYGTPEQRQAIKETVTRVHSDGTTPLLLMMKDLYANYVIQCIILQLKGAERDAFIEGLKPHLPQLKKYNYGKQITAIEKAIYAPLNQSYLPTSISPTLKTAPVETNSAAATPLLTNGQNSPQSCSPPSTNVSTVDDSTEVVACAKPNSSVKLDAKACPEVVIHQL